MSSISTRITIEPGRRSGQPCIRGLRISAWGVLGWLGAGMTKEEILDDIPTSRRRTFLPCISMLRSAATQSSGEVAPPGA